MKNCCNIRTIYGAEIGTFMMVCLFIGFNSLLLVLENEGYIRNIWNLGAVVMLDVSICLMLYYWKVVSDSTGIYHREHALMLSLVTAMFLFFSDLGFFFLGRFRRKKRELIKTEQEKELLEDYNVRLENLYKEVRGFKHDYINILSSLYFYMEEENYSEMKQYFKEEILTSGQNLAKQDGVIGKLYDIKIPEIKGIVYLKLLMAFQENLNVKVEVKEEISYIAMKSEDLVRVLGIFLDNAMEASGNTEEKYLYIGFLSMQDEIYIKVENSLSASIEGVGELSEFGFSTKGKERGVGLYSAEQILSRYSNVLHSVEIKNNRFIQTLKICREGA